MDPTMETYVGKAAIRSWLASLEPAPGALEPLADAVELDDDEPAQAPFEREVKYGDLLDLRDDIAALGEQVATGEDLCRLQATLREENRRKDLELYAAIRAEMQQLRNGCKSDIEQLRLQICKDFRAELASHVGALEQRLVERIDQRLETAP
jgi:hypothetical protein